MEYAAQLQNKTCSQITEQNNQLYHLIHTAEYRYTQLFSISLSDHNHIIMVSIHVLHTKDLLL